MKFRRSLHFRIFISYAIFGIAIGVVLFFFLYLSYNSLEDNLISEFLEDEMEFFVTLVEKNPGINSHVNKNLAGYRVVGAEKIQLFPFLNKLTPGIHETYTNNRYYAINVAQSEPYRYYIVYDITDFEIIEHQLTFVFSISILLAVLGSIWYGYLLGDRVLAPVKHLAIKLKLIPIDDLNVRVSQEFAKDEVGSLANSFDSFLERIQSFVDREKHFVSDASHELRTPIAVIQSTTEMLLSDTRLHNKDKDRLLRIQRAVKHISLSITALLILAREPNPKEKQQGGISIADIVSDIFNACREGMDQDRVSIELSILAEPEIAVPDSIVSLLVGNILQNAVRYTPDGSIHVVLDHNTLCVSDTGIGIPQIDIKNIFERGYRARNVLGDGSGLGLALVKRICDHFGWSIDVTSDNKKGVAVTWRF